MIALNTQPAEKPVYDPKGDLDVVNVWSTIQGEGPLAGTPAVFVRTAGCSLACGRCDTQYTKGRQLHSAKDLYVKVWALHPPPYLVVLTGGEPLRQNITPFVKRLTSEGYTVQIETNGVHAPSEGLPFHNVVVVCSPKTGTIHPQLRPYVNALKYVVEASSIDPKDGLPLTTLGNTCGVARPWPSYGNLVYVQPLDVQDPEKNVANRKAAVESCLRFGYKLSLQIHKDLGLE